MHSPLLDDFPVILIASTLNDGVILYTNAYLEECIGEVKKSNATKANLSTLLSKASLIFYESHIKPSLLEYGKLNEIQLTVITEKGERLPVVANFVLKEQIVYWSMYVCVARDKLYQELIAAREVLEEESEELAAIARIDPLTGIYNRRAAQDEFKKIHQQIRRQYFSLVVLMIDIDWFKKINDQFGHDVGDDMLCLLSNVMKRHVREVDILSRWGGEEFLIALFDTNLDGALKFTKRLMDDVRKTEVDDKQSLTISIGMANISHEMALKSNCLDIVIKQADIALYAAKKQGRDRVVIWQEHL